MVQQPIQIYASHNTTPEMYAQEDPSMLFGTFQAHLSLYGRLVVPDQFYADLAPECVLTRGVDGCLQLFPARNWFMLSRQLWGSVATSGSDRTLRRLVCAGAAALQLDHEGGFCIPAPLLAYAGIVDTVVLAGLHTHIELWAATRWYQMVANLDGT